MCEASVAGRRAHNLPAGAPAVRRVSLTRHAAMASVANLVRVSAEMERTRESREKRAASSAGGAPPGGTPRRAHDEAPAREPLPRVQAVGDLPSETDPPAAIVDMERMDMERCAARHSFQHVVEYTRTLRAFELVDNPF